MTPTNQRRVDAQYKALNTIVTTGIPKCYANMDEFFTDFWMDFSWDESMKEEVQAILDHPQFLMSIQTPIMAMYGFDVQAELVKGRDFDPDAQ